VDALPRRKLWLQPIGCGKLADRSSTNCDLRAPAGHGVGFWCLCSGLSRPVRARPAAQWPRSSAETNHPGICAPRKTASDLRPALTGSATGPTNAGSREETPQASGDPILSNSHQRGGSTVRPTNSNGLKLCWSPPKGPKPLIPWCSMSRAGLLGVGKRLWRTPDRERWPPNFGPHSSEGKLIRRPAPALAASCRREIQPPRICLNRWKESEQTQLTGSFQRNSAARWWPGRRRTATGASPSSQPLTANLFVILDPSGQHHRVDFPEKSRTPGVAAAPDHTRTFDYKPKAAGGICLPV